MNTESNIEIPDKYGGGCRMIVDAGSTKTIWVVKEDSNTEIQRITTTGINALLMSEAQITDIIRQVATELREYPERISYYGAGCATDDICKKLRSLLSAGFRCNEIEVGSDLLGAARGMLGTQPGIACILGTGSNSCLYDGENIVRNIRSLGYVLGDEGSGNALGKRLLRDKFRGMMPTHLEDCFDEEYRVTYDDLLQMVYRESGANRKLAAFAPFIARHIEDEYMQKIAGECFDSFFREVVTQYDGYEDMPIAICGGVAAAFEEQLRESGKKFGIDIAKISKGII